MPGYSYSASAYRYGFNGQETETDITGSASHTSAEFWMYDSRLGRRWEVDPVVVVSISSYACFYNSPLRHSDINGDSPGDPDKTSGSINVSAKATFTFGGAKGTSYFNCSVGVSGMANIRLGLYSGQLAATATFNFTNGGLGMALGKSDTFKNGQSTLFLAASATAGYESAATIQQNLFNAFSVSTLSNDSKFSITYAADKIIASGGRNQKDATIAMRFDRVSLFVIEDSDAFGFAPDGEDRWWTGSGELSFDMRGMGKGLFNSVTLSSDTYTGDSKNGNSRGEVNDYPELILSENGKYYYQWANQEQLDAPGQIGFNRSLNMAQTALSVKMSSGVSIRYAQTGPKHFFPQNVVHHFLDFHRFPPTSDVPNNLVSISYEN